MDDKYNNQNNVEKTIMPTTIIQTIHVSKLTTIGILTTVFSAMATILPIVQIAHATPVTQNYLAHNSTHKFSESAYLPYANPNAPKGGTLSLQAIGAFNSANKWMNTGVAMAGTDYLFDTLMIGSHNEAFTQYAQLAEKVTYDPDDTSWIIYHINPQARFSDESEVTAVDVKSTMDTLLTKGPMWIKSYLAEIDTVEVLDKYQVKFNFKSDTNKEILLTAGQFPVFKKESIEADFEKISLTPLIGSGPYVLDTVDAGRSVVYKRNPKYWGQDLMVNNGRYNFDTIKYVYYMNDEIAFEGFKAGQYAFRQENKSRNWATAYTFPAVTNGDVIKESIDKRTPAAMQGLVMNTRHTLFQDRKLRQALTLAYDFNWTNKTMFYGQYEQPSSYFYHSEMEATGKPSQAEMAVIHELKPLIPKDEYQSVIREWQLPQSDGKGYHRTALMQASKLLKQAGYYYQDMKLMTPEGTPAKFEILMASGGAMTRIILPYVRNLKRLGFDVNIREVDRPQYIQRVRSYDYDMIVDVFAQSMSPGAEQLSYWGSKAADEPSNRNTVGIKNPAINKAIDKLIASKNRDDIILYCKVLDRLLRAGYYIVPMNTAIKTNVAYRKNYKHGSLPFNTLDIDYWWYDDSAK